MINKQLNDITWADLELLKTIGREEDDRIEYKAAFSGGEDYRSLGDKQRTAANVAIAKEVVAFLNGRGGDVLIGVQEAANSHPKIEAFPLISDADEIANRLAAALSALIEPAQSLVNVRVIKPEGENSAGVIMVRAPASQRAPHRVKQDKECYIRRGSSSFPMPMDEIQDMVLNRSLRRNERLALLDAGFDKVRAGMAGFHKLAGPRMHIRLSFMPLQSVEFEIDSEILNVISSSTGRFSFKVNQDEDSSALRGLGGNWTPILAGRSSSMISNRPEEIHWRSKSITRFGNFSIEFCSNGTLFGGDQNKRFLSARSLIGFLSNGMSCICNIADMKPEIFPGLIKIGVAVEGDVGLMFFHNFTEYDTRFENGFFELPLYEIENPEAIMQQSALIFEDLLSSAGFRFGERVELVLAK